MCAQILCDRHARKCLPFLFTCFHHPTTLIDKKGRVPATFGQELVRGLLNDDPTLSIPSARVLGHLLRGCPAVKERLLTQMVEAHPQLGGPERLLLPTLVGRVRAYFEAMGACGAEENNRT